MYLEILGNHGLGLQNSYQISPAKPPEGQIWGHNVELNVFFSASAKYCLQCIKFNCMPNDRGYYGSCLVTVPVQRDFLCSTYKPHFLLWQRSGHPILLVAQELKLCFGESKM